MKNIQKKYRELSAEDQVRIIARVANEQKALEVVALDVRGLASFADFFVIMGGTSTRHVQGLADVIDREISSKRVKSTETEGAGEGHWILLDYGDLIVHIFYHETRPDYDLEGLWHDAPRLDLTKPAPVVKETVSKKPARKGASWTPAKVLERSAQDKTSKAEKVKKVTVKAAAKASAKPTRKSVAKPTRKTVEKPARKTTAKPAGKVASKPERKSPGKSALQAADQPARWTAEKPAKKAADKPARWKAGKPVKKGAEKSEKWTSEKPAGWTVENPARKAAAKPARRAVGAPVKKSSPAKPKSKPVGRVKK